MTSLGLVTGLDVIICGAGLKLPGQLVKTDKLTLEIVPSFIDSSDMFGIFDAMTKPQRYEVISFSAGMHLAWFTGIANEISLDRISFKLTGPIEV